jgi:hypothetical protein
MKNMNNQFKRITATFLGAMGIAGVSQANAQEVRAIPSKPLVESLRTLLRDGVIIPLAKPNWYRINQGLLDAKINGQVESTTSIPELIESLRDVVGPDVNVREVEMFEAVVGTQDFK